MKIAILGAGLMGRLLALRLYQEGYTNLVLIDRNEFGSSDSPAMIAGGMLACLTESVAGGELIYQLGKDSIKLWSHYLKSMDAQHLLNSNGTLLIAPPQFSGEVAHYIDKIKFNTQLIDTAQLIEETGINKLEPELKFKQAYFLPGEGALAAPEVMQLLADYLQRRIIWQANSEVTQVKPDGTVILKDKPEIFDQVFDCRGLGAGAVYSDLRGVRGEIIRVHAPDVSFTRAVRLFHPRQNIYIVPNANHHYTIGATEIEAEDYSPVSVRSALELLGYAYSVHSGFAEARIISMASNCRPALKNNLPQIKADGQLLAINGLSRHGFLLAPALAETVIQYLADGSRQYQSIWS